MSRFKGKLGLVTKKKLTHDAAKCTEAYLEKLEVSRRRNHYILVVLYPILIGA